MENWEHLCAAYPDVFAEPVWTPGDDDFLAAARLAVAVGP